MLRASEFLYGKRTESVVHACGYPLISFVPFDFWTIDCDEPIRNTGFVVFAFLGGDRKDRHNEVVALSLHFILDINGRVTVCQAFQRVFVLAKMCALDVVGFRKKAIESHVAISSECSKAFQETLFVVLAVDALDARR